MLYFCSEKKTFWRWVVSTTCFCHFSSMVRAHTKKYEGLLPEIWAFKNLILAKNQLTFFTLSLSLFLSLSSSLSTKTAMSWCRQQRKNWTDVVLKSLIKKLLICYTFYLYFINDFKTTTSCDFEIFFLRRKKRKFCLFN